jgi:hypothetical protein
MAICEADPWRLQYFAGVPCPDGVNIPTEDADAYRWFPAHRWLYDKIAVAESQGLAAGPHGLAPRDYPVFSKPIINLRGMGTGGRVLRSAAEYRRYLQPGHMWMTLLRGEHVSSDVAVVDGRAAWWRHAVGIPRARGTFDRWIVEAASRPALEAACGAWIGRHLRGYCGMLNVETIGGRIIEVHLRFADQWPDLYGPGWVEALIRLYADGRWRFRDRDRRTGYSVILFGPHGRRYRYPPGALSAALLKRRHISSLQFTFHESRPPRQHAMPPGGFRLAIVNCWSLAAGRRARRDLARAFEVAASHG